MERERDRETEKGRERFLKREERGRKREREREGVEKRWYGVGPIQAVQSDLVFKLILFFTRYVTFFA